MVALYQISTNTVIQSYGDGVPAVISVPGLDVHAPQADWASGDYMFIPVVYQGAPNNDLQITTGQTEVLTFDGNGSPSYVVTTTYGYPSLSDVQNNLCDRLDRHGRELRMKYATGDAAQFSIYVLRYLEARQILADPSPDANNYPLHAVFVNTVFGNTISDAANTTITQSKVWIGAGAGVDKVRLIAKAQIMGANSIAGALYVFNHVDWGNL